MRRLGRIAVVGIAIAAATAVLVIWWLPLPRELQTSVVGTLTLLDNRGREIAEIASPEARVQIPVQLSEMGNGCPG